MANLLITKMLVPSYKYNTKCPFEMSPIGITVHNTANDASALNEISYMISNNNQVSFHYAVDDYRAVQGIPETQNAWHASDGSEGTGNRRTIAIEICYSKSGGDRFTQAEKNAAMLVAMLCKKYGWTTANVKRHHDYAVDKKYCPHRTMDLGWDRWLNMVKEYLGETIKLPLPSTPVKPANPGNTVHSLNELVHFTGLATSSSATSHTTNIAVNSGKITRIVPGAKYPYLINGGTGWVNDALITTPGANTPVDKPSTPASSSTRKIGDTITINGVFTSSSSSDKLTPAKTSGKITKILSGARNPYLLDDGNLGWTNDSCITSKPSNTNAKPATPATSSKSVGNTITINGIFSSSSSTQVLKPARTTGKITQILKGARNPYLLDNGNLGWVDDAHIVSGSTSKPTPAPTTPTPSTKEITVGTKVRINGVFTSSSSIQVLKPGYTDATVTKILSGARNPYLLDNGNLGWVDKAHIVKIL